MESLSTLIFYIFVFAILFFLARTGEKKNNKKYIIWAYVLFFLLTALRYDTGNDYQGYYTSLDYMCGYLFGGGSSLSVIWDNYLYLSGNEPMYFILAYLFHWLPYPALFVIAIYSAISIYFFYKAFDEYKIHSYAFIMFFATGFLFWYWDLIRQSAAIAMFFFALKFIRDGNFWKYTLVILIAMLFHYSALFLLLLYPLRYVNLNRWIYVGVIMASVVVLFLGYSFDNIFDYIGNLPFYDSYENDKRIGEHYEGFGYKLRMTCYALVAVVSVLKLPKTDNYLKGIITIGAVLLIVSQGNLLIDRIAVYVYYTVIIGFAYATKYSRNMYSIACRLLIVALLVLQSKSVLDGSDRGCSPYMTVFSDDFAHGRFKEKDY